MKLLQKLKHIRIDGVPNIFNARILLFKLIWICLLFTTSNMSVYMIVTSAMGFLTFQVRSQLRLDSETRAIFPLITICNVHPLNSAYFIYLGQESNLTKNMTNGLSFNNFVVLANYYWKKKGSYFSSDELKNMSNTDDFIISCIFNNKPCRSSSIRYYFHRLSLQCIQFNSGFDSNGVSVKLEDVSVGGEEHGLKMEFYVGLPNVLSSLHSERGVYLSITNQSDDTDKTAPTVIPVVPGLGIKINVKRNMYKQFNEWPYAYSWCNVNEAGDGVLHPIDDMSLFNQVLSTNFSYSQDLCFLYCIQENIVDVCNCSFAWIDYLVNGSIWCYDPIQAVCATNSYYNNFTVGDYIERNCVPKCPLECNLHRYDNYKSYFTYPDQTAISKTQKQPRLVKAFGNQTDFTENIASNLVKLSVYYDSLTYFQVIEEAKISWADLLSEIGGHMHLFLGMSLISLIELAEVVGALFSDCRMRYVKYQVST